jgi:proline iminopeptidase
MHTTVNGTDLYLDVDGAQLTVAGDRLEERPTVVVLPGGPGFDQGYLRPGLAPLRADAQLVFVDPRGQGRSGPAAVHSCTLEQMADDVAALCEQLGIRRPTVFGHSASGFVALHLALRHPDVAGRLILCDTAPTLAPLPDAAPPPGLAQRASAEAVEVAGRLFGGDFSPATVEAFGRLVAPHYAAPAHPDVPGRLLALSGFAADVAAFFFRELAASYDVRAELAAIDVPALVVVGREDWVCPPAGARALAAGLPDARLVEIPGAGHFPFSEEPAAFLAAVRRFLDDGALLPGAPRVAELSAG